MITFFTGDYAAAIRMADDMGMVRPTVIGSLLYTEEQMADVGRSLKNVIGRDLTVFSNSEHIFNGVRIGVINKEISKDEIRFLHFHDNKSYLVQLNDHGKLPNWPPGFFSHNMAQLRTIAIGSMKNKTPA